MKQSEPKKYGKKSADWRRVRAAWVANNPPSHEGHYVCGICGRTVHIEDMELDHVYSRSRDPASRLDPTNLQPSHSWCNRRKGSEHVNPIVTTQEYELRRELDL